MVNLEQHLTFSALSSKIFGVVHEPRGTVDEHDMVDKVQVLVNLQANFSGRSCARVRPGQGVPVHSDDPGFASICDVLGNRTSIFFVTHSGPGDIREPYHIRDQDGIQDEIE